MNLEIIFIVTGAYLIGSISTSVWISRVFFNIDIREHGSGNAGTSNTLRVLGKKAAIIVFIIDVLKGLVATQIVILFKDTINPDYFIFYQIIAGIAAVVGHIFPVYTSFKGGKGVATLFGICLGFLTLPTLLSAVVFTLVFLLSGYSSLGSLTAGLSFPVFTLGLFQYSAISITVFVLIIPVLLIITHNKNIVRLINREENKIHFRKKNTS